MLRRPLLPHSLYIAETLRPRSHLNTRRLFKWGRFAFLDALAHSYPGFVMTGDQVRLLEHCRVCDRPGPVLDRVIKRMPSEDMRGCAEEVRRVFDHDLVGAVRG
jgi:hypothetical protein